MPKVLDPPCNFNTTVGFKAVFAYDFESVTDTADTDTLYIDMYDNNSHLSDATQYLI